MTNLADLVSQGLVEAVEVDETTATTWLEDASRHLDAAVRIADLDPSGAYLLASDAARKSIAAALLMTGHRIRSRPGAHRALARYADDLISQMVSKLSGGLIEYDATETTPSADRGPIEAGRAIRAACVKLT